MTVLCKLITLCQTDQSETCDSTPKKLKAEDSGSETEIEDDDDRSSQASTRSLRSHDKKENDKKLRFDVAVTLFRCQAHGMTFDDESSYLKHQQAQHKPQYQCDICQEKFKSKAVCNEHIKVTHGEKPYKCDIDGCTKAFLSRRGLNGHKELHRKNGKYLCRTCNTSFGTQQTLKNHMLTHSDEKNIPCDYCGRTFRRTNECTRHKKTCKEGKKMRAKAASVSPVLPNPVSCVLCGLKFEDKAELDKHLLDVHKEKEEFKCDDCPKSFGRKSQLTAHKLVHLKKERKN